MRVGLLFLIALLAILPPAFSQYNKKKFKDGYVLHGSDTTHCKIFWGSSVNEYDEVVIKYTDMGEPINTFAGGWVKGYGLKVDSVEKNFYAFPRMKFGVFKDKKEFVFGEVLAGSFAKLLCYKITRPPAQVVSSTNISNDNPPRVTPVWTPTGGKTEQVEYYLYKTGADTAISLNDDGLFRLKDFNLETIKSFFSDDPELTAKMKDKIKMEDLVAYINEYNERRLVKQKDNQ